MSWMATMWPLSDQLERRFEQELLGERIADLHPRALGIALVREVLGRERRAVDAVASGARANRDDRIAHALGLRADQLFLAHHADAHRVDERIALVRVVEHDFTGDGRHADAVAVVADALHDAGDELPHARVIECAETQGVEQRDGARAHREHVAQDSTDARRGALVWLDGRRVVVRLDLERDGESVADGNDARVLAGALEHVRRLRRQRLEDGSRVLVGAVLAPQRAHDAQLGERRRAAEHRRQALVLLGGQPVLGDERGSDDRIAGAGDCASFLQAEHGAYEAADAALVDVLDHFDFTLVEPHAAAIRAPVDLHVVVLDLLELAAALGATHVVRRALGASGARRRASRAAP